MIESRWREDTKKTLMIIIRAQAVLLLALLLAACSAAITPPPTTAPTQASTDSPSPPAATSTPTRRSTPRQPTQPPTHTPTVAPTPVPEGVFAVQYYPPLILVYDPEPWVDRSEYGNPEKLLAGNFLEHTRIEGCTIGVQGASGFYPENMRPVTLGDLYYEVYESSGETVQTAYRAYFALDPAFANVSAGIPIFGVRAGLPKAAACWDAAEAVLATLRLAQASEGVTCGMPGSICRRSATPPQPTSRAAP